MKNYGIKREGNGNIVELVSPQTPDVEILPVTDPAVADFLKHRPSAKEVRDESLAAMLYDFGDGRVMQVRPQDEQNIRNSIDIMRANNLASIDWVMADNVKHAVTVTDLQAALASGQLQGLAIWDAYVPD